MVSSIQRPLGMRQIHRPVGNDVLFHAWAWHLLISLNPHHLRECKIIDLGNDFRIESDMNREFVYGLCEMNREK